MRVTVHLPEFLRRYGGGEEHVAAEGATAGAALEDLFRTRPDLRVRVVDAHGAMLPYVLLFRNGEEVPRERMAGAPLAEGDVLELVAAVEGGSGDVRMRGFERRASLGDVVRACLADLPSLHVEEVPLAEAAGRLLAESVTADCDVPAFARAAMDGWAVRGEDTFGASLFDPVRLALAGESMPGSEGAPAVAPRTCVRIMTGAPVPEGADAVLPAEQGREEGADVLVHEPIPPAKNVGARGEDVRAGDAVLGAGRRLRPQDVGLLASLGRAHVRVRRRPRVRIVVTGNELVEAGGTASGNRIVDSNTPMLRALVRRDGAVVESAHRLRDEPEAIRAALTAPGADVILTAGGTSVGREDHVPLLVRGLGALLVHGVAMRPASPTGVGRIGTARVVLLPGNPVSCLAAYDLVASPAIRSLAGGGADPYERAKLRIARRIVSQIGRTDYVRVAADGTPIAASGASILSSTTRALGFVLVPEESEGFAEGSVVEVHLYDLPRALA